MSQKWERSKAWDDEHIPSWLWGAKFVLRAFSSITLAVVLLVFVSIYAMLASVPVGLLALAPTYLIYALSLVLPLALVWTGIIVIVSRLGHDRATRFSLGVIGLIVSGAACAWAWWALAWPMLRYDAISGTGVRLFADFVETYKATTLRRLPAFEMTELEFYSWWPMRAALLAFVVNMFVATVRRIEFTFKNIGVLTVHTGIIVIALGSIYYQKLKKEGNTILVAGVDTQTGVQGIGPPQTGFYDNTRVVLYAMQEGSQMGAAAWEQRPIRRLPRYNDYGLDVGDEHAQTSLWRQTRTHMPWEGIPKRTLSIDVPPTNKLIDEDIRLRVVGYASYADLKSDWLRLDPRDVDGALLPARILTIDAGGGAFSFMMLPSVPAGRVRASERLEFEYTLSMDERRWRDLSEPLEPDVQHALVIEVPDAGVRLVTPVSRGASIAVGETGYRVEVEQLSPRPPMPIVTRGYEGATSSVAVVKITTPGGQQFQRWAYSRFPELDQDILQETGATGRPLRRPADTAIRIAYIDATRGQVIIDETVSGTLRAIIRRPGEKVQVIDSLAMGEWLERIDGQMNLAVTQRWEHAEPFERPVPVPADERDKRSVGTHIASAVAVEVGLQGSDWSRVVWIPFTQYMGVGGEGQRSVRLPDGRSITLAFGRLRHEFPGFAVQLVDFEMIAYDHRGAPRDYQSTLRVSSTQSPPAFKPYTHVCKLNAPLRAPFHWDEDAPWVSNFVRRLAAGINPNQFKLSQAGWDQEGWNQSSQLVDQGALDRPFVRFTILGVGNNPGIHVIALGSILMGVGIPWAFYIKPWLIRREKARIQRTLAQRVTGMKPEPVAEGVV